MAEAAKTTKKKKAAPAETPKAETAAAAGTFGVADIAKEIESRGGKAYKTRDLRTLIRGLARSGKINREIIPGNKTRYDWPKGLKDPEVQAIIAAVVEGGIEKHRNEALSALKAKGAEKKAKEKAEKAEAEVVESDEEDDEEEEDDDE